MRLNTLAIAAATALGAGWLSAHALQDEPTLASLATQEVMRVTVDGRGVKSPTDGKRAVYFEIVRGVRNGHAWVSFEVERRTSDDLLVTTPVGVTTVPPLRLRLFLRPASMRKSRKRGEVVAEYRLLPGRAYYARVITESFLLPPRGEGMPPERAVNHVLQLSDRPIVGSAPVGAMTPGTSGVTY